MRDRDTRLLTDAALLTLTGALILAISIPALAPARPVLALVVFAFLPGAAVLTLAPVDTLLSWCLLSILLSLSIETLTSLLTLYTHLWHPMLLAGILGAASIGLLVLDVVRTERREISTVG